MLFCGDFFRHRRYAVELVQLGEGCRGQAAPCIKLHNQPQPKYKKEPQ